MSTMYWQEIDSPIGPLLLAGDRETLRCVSFQRPGRSMRPEPSWRKDASRFSDVRAQLEQYFAGERREFSLKLAFDGSEFQQTVWQFLQTIPYGTTTTYGEIAARIGRPGAARAVGLANGSNPIPIIVPCHRVIGADGSLTGFGGGLATKRALLALEASGNSTDLFATLRA